MHWGAMVANPTLGALAHEAGFHSTSRYNVAHAKKTQPDFTERYEDVMEAHREHWKNMATAPIVNMPVVTMGWDSTPRCRADVPWPFAKVEYPYVPVVVGNTPERYEQLLKDAANHVQGDPKKPFAILLNAWNEWTEGGYLLPEERTGTAYLEAIKRTFGPAKSTRAPKMDPHMEGTKRNPEDATAPASAPHRMPRHPNASNGASAYPAREAAGPPGNDTPHSRLPITHPTPLFPTSL